MISRDAHELAARIVAFYRKYENDRYGIDDDWYYDCAKMIDDEMDKVRLSTISELNNKDTRDV